MDTEQFIKDLVSNEITTLKRQSGELITSLGKVIESNSTLVLTNQKLVEITGRIANIDARVEHCVKLCQQIITFFHK